MHNKELGPGLLADIKKQLGLKQETQCDTQLTLSRMESYSS